MLSNLTNLLVFLNFVIIQFYKGSIMKKLLVILSTISLSSFAMVPITTSLDPSALEAAALAASQASTYMQQISQAKTVLDQVQGLKGLQQLQSAGSGLCNLCNKSDQEQLTEYVNNINGDLCTQFSNSMQNLGAAQKGLQNISGIIGALSGANPQAASLSLAQSSATTLQSLNTTMAQMQAMQAQIQQKQLAQEKQNQTYLKDFGTTFAPGL